MSKYKLVKVTIEGRSEFQPIDPVTGKDDGPILFVCEDDVNEQYAIYENLGDDEIEDWQEYSWWGDDLDGATLEYEKLSKTF